MLKCLHFLEKDKGANIAPIDKFGAVYNGTITAAATATPVQPGPTPGAPAVTVAGSTSPIGVVSSPTVDGSSVTTDTKMNIGLDSVMESQAAQLNLLLYQIYRPYFNGKEYFLSLIAIKRESVSKGFEIFKILISKHKYDICIDKRNKK